jgi:hypothetical protein
MASAPFRAVNGGVDNLRALAFLVGALSTCGPNVVSTLRKAHRDHSGTRQPQVKKKQKTTSGLNVSVWLPSSRVISMRFPQSANHVRPTGDRLSNLVFYRRCSSFCCDPIGLPCRVRYRGCSSRTSTHCSLSMDRRRSTRLSGENAANGGSVTSTMPDD